MRDKRAIRKHIRQRRRDRSDASTTRTQVALTHAWPTLQDLQPVTTRVLAFQPTAFEPDPRGLVRAILRLGLPVLLPRPIDTETLEWVSATSAHLEERQASIPNPNGPTECTAAEPLLEGGCLVLLPALAVDPHTGTRLGHGGGYYDRLLAEARQAGASFTTVAVVFDDELIDLAAEPHDQRVDAVLTESGLRRIVS